MLTDYSDRTMTFFAADYEPQVAYARKLADAAEAMQSVLQTPSWIHALGQYALRDPGKRLVAVVGHGRVFWEVIGTAPFEKTLTATTSTIMAALNALGVKRLKRVGYKTITFAPLSMTHPEICELMFGSFLPDASVLEPVCGRPNDMAVQLHTRYREMRLVLNVLPQTAEQVRTVLFAQPNLDLLLDNRYTDTGIRDFLNIIQHDCLTVDVDVYREDGETPQAAPLEADCVPPFLATAIRGAAEATQSAINHVRRLKL